MNYSTLDDESMLQDLEDEGDITAEDLGISQASPKPSQSATGPSKGAAEACAPSAGGVDNDGAGQDGIDRAGTREPDALSVAYAPLIQQLRVRPEVVSTDRNDDKDNTRPLRQSESEDKPEPAPPELPKQVQVEPGLLDHGTIVYGSGAAEIAQPKSTMEHLYGKREDYTATAAHVGLKVAPKSSVEQPSELPAAAGEPGTIRPMQSPSNPGAAPVPVGSSRQVMAGRSGEGTGAVGSQLCEHSQEQEQEHPWPGAGGLQEMGAPGDGGGVGGGAAYDAPHSSESNGNASGGTSSGDEGEGPGPGAAAPPEAGEPEGEHGAAAGLQGLSWPSLAAPSAVPASGQAHGETGGTGLLAGSGGAGGACAGASGGVAGLGAGGQGPGMGAGKVAAPSSSPATAAPSRSLGDGQGAMEPEDAVEATGQLLGKIQDIIAGNTPEARARAAARAQQSAERRARRAQEHREREQLRAKQKAEREAARLARAARRTAGEPRSDAPKESGDSASS